MRTFCSVFLLALVACGGSDPTSSDDPRCQALCTSGDVGSGITCSAASIQQCVVDCEAKVYDAPDLCGSCLLENAEFPAYDVMATNPGDLCQAGTSSQVNDCSCDDGGPWQCTRTVAGNSCTYDPAVAGQFEGCLDTWYPDGHVACETYFPHELSDCTSFCAS
jgi:hypothetical protein